MLAEMRYVGFQLILNIDDTMLENLNASGFELRKSHPIGNLTGNYNPLNSRAWHH